MHTIRRKFLLNAFKLFDLFVMSLCFYWALHLCLDRVAAISFAQLIQTNVKILDLIFYIFMLVIWQISFTSFGLYRSKRFSSQKKEIIDIFKSATVGSLMIFTTGLLFRVRFLSPTLIVYFFILVNVTTVTYRIILRYLLKKVRSHGRNLRRMLIVGTNERAIQFAEKIIKTPDLGYFLIGFVDDDWSENKISLPEGHSVVCNLKEVSDFIRKEVVDDVMIVIPVKSYYKIASQIVSICEEQGIIVRHVSNIYSHEIEFIGDIPSIKIYKSTIDGWPAFFKRLIDLVLALFILILLSPLFIATAIAIMLSSPGPIFFIQNRVGLGKRIFRLYKFRTMLQDAEEKQNEIEYLNEASGPAFKIKSDPRVTKLGRFLRKKSIDELPQLINVIKGDMSLVGPRPLPVRDFNGFSADWHRRRFCIRPGITCLWQINGRHEIEFDKWMKLDMEYIDQWTLLLDAKILIKTIPAVLKGSGAS